MSSHSTSVADDAATTTRHEITVTAIADKIGRNDLTADDQAEVDFWTAALEEHSNRAMLNISRQALAKLLGIISKLRTEQREPVSQEAPSEHRCGVRGFDGMKGDVCPACSVISSASPLSEDVLALMPYVKHHAYCRLSLDTVTPCSCGLSNILGVIGRLSSSAPSPEDAPAEPTLVVGFNRETGNPTVEARSVETSDFCAACVRGYCEDRYSIRECRGHWHVTMCGADLAIPGDPFASAEIAQRAADAENRGRDPGGEA
jgi:hypothetical protein